MNKNYFIYFLASKRNGTLYIGITDDLKTRVYQHILVYYEAFTNVNDAILREKRLKKWKRKWKVELIEKKNPEWKDLYDKLI